MKQAKDKIFWPSMKGELRNVYVPINIVEEQINVSLTLNFNVAFSLGRGSN